MTILVILLLPFGRKSTHVAELTWADKIAGVNTKVRELFCNRKLLKGICYSI